MKIKDILAIVAVALTVGGCNQQDDGLRQDDRVPIKLRASVQDAAIGQTRATTTYTTQNTEFLADELVDAYIFKSDGTTPLATGTNPLGLKVTASFTDAYSVLHVGDLEPVSSTEPKYYYPTDGSGVKIYAVHPSVTSAASFSVETDQTTDDKYAKSDLCYSPMGSYSAQTASQLLTFNHVLSKIVVNITNEINNNNLPTTVKLMAKKTTAMTYPTNTAPYYTLDAASDPATITMAMTTVGTTASGGVVIPPQSFAKGASFLSFTIPDIGPMIYPMPAATNFESGKRYTYNIKVTDVGITVSSSIEDWGTKPAAQTVLGKKYYIRPTLPIEYVAEYNMSNATTMASDHLLSNSGLYNESQSLTTFDKHVTITGKSGTYHLPSVGEMNGITPFQTMYFDQEQFVQSGLDAEHVQCGKRIDNTFVVPLQDFYNEFATSASYCTANEYVAYAIRLKAEDVAGPLGYGPYTCAYRYTYYVQDPVCNNNESLHIKVRYLGPYSTIELSDITNAAFWQESGVEYFERVFPAFGFYNPQWYYTETVYYRTSTMAQSFSTYNNYYNLVFRDNQLSNQWITNTGYQTPIRLFKDAE